MSSLIVVGDIAAVSLWPYNLARIEEGGYDMRVREGWRHMPQGFDALLDWVQVIPVTQANARRGEKRVVYSCRDRPAESLFNDMTMLMHGFVHSQNLLPLGNWNGREQSTASAVQYLTLVSGGQDAAFAPQQEALKHLRELVHDMSGAKEIARETSVQNGIRLERNVFTRVRSEEGADELPKAQLTDDEDPGGKARKLAARWVVSPLLPTCVRRSGGGDKGMSYHSIRPGDFVEVVVSPEIYQVQQEGRMKPSLHLVMKKVVKIRSAQDAKSILERGERQGSSSAGSGSASAVGVRGTQGEEAMMT